MKPDFKLKPLVIAIWIALYGDDAPNRASVHY